MRLTPPCPAAGNSPQLASAESLLTDAERRNRRSTCLLHISDVTPVRHAQGTVSIVCEFVACAAAVQTAVLVPFGPSCLGHYRPLQLLHAHCCLLHIISDGTRVRHAQGITLSILRAFIACATVQTAVLVLFGPSCLGHYGPLQLLHAHCLGLLLLSVCVFSKTTCTGTKKKEFFHCRINTQTVP